MRRLSPLLLSVLLAVAPGVRPADACPTAPGPPEHSDLWGVDGELWDPAGGRLADFTNVGYLSGTVAIPDETAWPVGADVTDFGAIPGDGVDDSQAFIDAIAACPDEHAVFVPAGRYTILQQIVPDRDYFVLRGEDMYRSVLHFPKYLNEIYVQEVGYGNPAYDDGSNGPRHTGVPKGFFRVAGGTHRSIENLTFEFRDQRKMGHWEHKGASALYYGDDVADSWVRNIYVVNGDNALMMGRAHRISFLNIIFDHDIGRPDIIGSGSTHRWVGHIGMSMSNAQHCLFHGIEFRGNYFHEFDNINVPKNCVVSNVTGTDVSLHHHGGGARNNLYTNACVGNGPGLSGLGPTQDSETHWRIFGSDTLEAPTDPANLSNNHVFVGYDSPQGEIIDATTWYEVVEPTLLEPPNIYLAQLAHPSIGKPLPEGPPPAPPSRFAGDVIRLNPVEDSHADAANPDVVQDPSAKTLPVGDDLYFKFELDGLDLRSIATVRLRLSSTRLQNTPVGLAVSSVDDDSWTGGTLTHASRPPAVALLDALVVGEDSRAQVLDFDVTPFVQAEWAGDRVVSLVLTRISGNGALSGIRSSEMGLAPELIVEQVASSVPGAPSPPAGLRSYSLIGNVRLDWADNPESDVATYNVYRSAASADFSQYAEPIATGLLTSDFVDIQHQHETGWDVGMMRDDQPYHYRVTAVDEHGYESASSLEIVGTARGHADDNLPPAFLSDPVILPGATQYAAYAESLAGSAADPEGDALYFSKVDGPEWLSIARDGTLSGTPRLGDTGTFELAVQVNSLGSGRDEAVVRATVEPGPPDAPTGLDVLAGDAGVQLDWAHASEGSPGFTFSVYRSLVEGGPYSRVATGLTASAHADSGLSNATTYHYVVTAANPSGESPRSVEVSATPRAGYSDWTHFLGGSLSEPTDWDAGLPVGRWGRIQVDGTADTSVAYEGWTVLHAGGTLEQSGIGALRLANGSTWITEGPGATTSTGFRGFEVRGGSSLTLREGSLRTAANRDWRVQDAGSVLTVEGGTLHLGRHLLLSAGGELTVSGGVLSGNPGSGDLGVRSFASGGTVRFDGGSTTIHRLDAGGANATFRFGGSAAGSVTATAFTGPFGSGSTIDFLPGTLMSLTVGGEDEWAAARWAAGELTYDSRGAAELGSWDAVTAPDGLGPGVRFAYDSATETLSVAGPVADADGDGLDDSWELVHFGSPEVVDGSVDSDGDGVRDFFEFLHGSDPNAVERDGFRLLARRGPAGIEAVFDWSLREGVALGIDYQVFVSTDLSAWEVLPVEDYWLQQETAGGMTRTELFLATDRGARVYLRLDRP